ncbi:MAG: hypothetical protein E7012_02900 [Alphaproteobacteria bacterium]|nr:hypothetical protein [Alphaproteobacteria bacterium]
MESVAILKKNIQIIPEIKAIEQMVCSAICWCFRLNMRRSSSVEKKLIMAPNMEKIYCNSIINYAPDIYFF